MDEEKLHITIKYSDVKYYRGGSKTPLRLRKHQNITLGFSVSKEKYDKGFTREELIYILESKRNYLCGKNCKIKVKKMNDFF